MKSASARYHILSFIEFYTIMRCKYTRVIYTPLFAHALDTYKSVLR